MTVDEQPVLKETLLAQMREFIAATERNEDCTLKMSFRTGDMEGYVSIIHQNGAMKVGARWEPARWL